MSKRAELLPEQDFEAIDAAVSETPVFRHGGDRRSHQHVGQPGRAANGSPAGAGVPRSLRHAAMTAQVMRRYGRARAHGDGRISAARDATCSGTPHALFAASPERAGGGAASARVDAQRTSSAPVGARRRARVPARRRQRDPSSISSGASRWTRADWKPPGHVTRGLRQTTRVLGPDAIAVHLCATEPEELRAVARCKAPPCCAPRSNLFIELKLPPLYAILDARPATRTGYRFTGVQHHAGRAGRGQRAQRPLPTAWTRGSLAEHGHLVRRGSARLEPSRGGSPARASARVCSWPWISRIRVADPLRPHSTFPTAQAACLRCDPPCPARSSPIEEAPLSSGQPRVPKPFATWDSLVKFSHTCSRCPSRSRRWCCALPFAEVTLVQDRWLIVVCIAAARHGGHGRSTAWSIATSMQTIRAPRTARSHAALLSVGFVRTLVLVSCRGVRRAGAAMPGICLALEPARRSDSLSGYSYVKRFSSLCVIWYSVPRSPSRRGGAWIGLGATRDARLPGCLVLGRRTLGGRLRRTLLACRTRASIEAQGFTRFRRALARAEPSGSASGRRAGD